MFDGNSGATVLDQRAATEFTAPSSPSCTKASFIKFLASHNSSVWKCLNFVHHLVVRMFFTPRVQDSFAVSVGL